MIQARFIVPLAAIAASFLTGCAGIQQRNHVLSVPFEADEARAMLDPGPNTVSGSSLIRQAGGGIVTCAGNPVFLLPATAYADERVNIIYGNYQSGYVPYAGLLNHSFTPDDPEYKNLTEQTRCDAQGNFEFTNVADGEFYVHTLVTWSVNYTTQGGGLMRRVDLEGGEHEKIVLTP